MYVAAMATFGRSGREDAAVGNTPRNSSNCRGSHTS